MKSSFGFPLLFTLITLGIFLIIISCADDGDNPCLGVNCQNGGICQSGDCQCPDGFYGESCELEDLCFDINCGKNASCDTLNRTCFCNPGYRKCDSVSNDCLCIIREALVGDYKSYNTPLNASYTYTRLHRVTYTSPSPEIFVINEFGGYSSPVINLPVVLINETQFIVPPYTDTGYFRRTFISGSDDIVGNNPDDFGTYYPATGNFEFTYNVTSSRPSDRREIFHVEFYRQ